jgi:glycosyltransferase involved in cell wall biosynthesis
MEMQRRALALADELGARDRSVFFNEGWAPYHERGAYFLEADAGVSAHFDDVETRFAFRTRLLDCIWAGLPIVCTRGDTLADLVEQRRLGRTVEPESVEGWVAALDAVLGDASEREAVGARAAEVRAELAWPRVVEPLRRLVEGGATRPRGLSPLAGADYAAARLENAVRTHGPREAGARLLGNLTGRQRPLEDRAKPPLR